MELLGVRNNIIGLLGIGVLILYIIFTEYLGILNINYSDRFILYFKTLILIIGLSFFLAGYLSDRIKTSINNYRFNNIIDSIISKYALLLVVFLVIIGFYFRINDLGKLSFWADELFTTYAAIGLSQNGSAILPSGMSYTRSILNTFFIALSFETLGISEFSARIISVIFGTLIIPLVYLMGVKLANRRVGLLAAVLIIFSIFEILWSRQARMYAQFQFFYLLTSYLFYSGLKKYDFKILLLSGIAFLCAYLSHVQALIFLPVSVLYIFIYKLKILKKKHFIYGSVAFFGVALFHVLVTGKIPLNNISQNAPVWAQKPFYYYAFAPDLIFLFFIVFISCTISLILLKLKRFKLGEADSYLLLNFFIPFIILSLFPWKDPRYALFIYPFLILLASSAFDLYVFRGLINDEVCERISDAFKLRIKIVRNIKFAILFLLIMLVFIQMAFSTEAFHISQSNHGNINDLIFSNWKKGTEYVKNRVVSNDKIITTLPVASLYYLGKSDFYLRQNEYEGNVNSEGQLVDNYTGAVILDSYNSFIQKVNESRGWVIVDYRIDTYYVDTEVRDYIRNNMTFHPDGSDSTIEVYSWNVSQ